MITMDVKGITWVGGVYQKFETMCLEVEENMYQDTVKFVEDQVQTVGSSVKKFYADVMQDLLSDSSMDPEMSTSGCPVEHSFDVDSSKKSVTSKKREPVKVDGEQLNRDSEVPSVLNKDVNHKPLFHGQPMHDYHKLSSENCTEEAFAELYSREDHDWSPFNNANLDVKENPIKQRFPKTIPPVEKEMSGQSSSCHVTPGTSCEHTDTVIDPSIAEDMACSSTREALVISNASQYTDDGSIDCQSSDKIFLDKLGRKERKEMLDSSCGDSSAESNGSSPIGQVQYERNADQEASASHPGKSYDSSLNAIDSNTVAVQGMETIQQCDKAKLEDTCVMVTDEDVHFVPHMEGKHRPYKKKIQKAFSSRMRSARKQEYEQLALWYVDDTKSNVENGEDLVHSLTMEDTEKSPVRDFCESEWEIL